MAQLTESDGTAGIAMSFPVNDETASCSTSKAKIPRRLRKRLLEQKSPATAEEIDAKLKEARLRRQQFCELLSSKARTRLKSSSPSTVQEEDRSQQLEAKLKAAERKRLSLLAKAQMRLARLAKLRLAAKTGVKMRIDKECDDLGLKVESRVQQAEAKRMLLIKADGERRAAKKEGATKSLMKKKIQESRYRERVHAAICQKQAAAEKRRLGLLEAEKKRAHAKALQVQQVAKVVCFQREIERRRLRDQLDDRLQRAKNYRVECLGLRRSLHQSANVNPGSLQEQEERLSKSLARCWRQFKSLRKTTYDIAKEYEALGINKESARLLTFEQLAFQIESATAIRIVKALCARLESRITISQSFKCRLFGLDNIDHLLKRVVSPNRKCSSGDPMKSKGIKNLQSSREAAQIPVKLPRYPVRVLLCAYMVVGHPDAVLSGKAEHEIDLVDSTGNFIQEFELLIKVILNGPIQASQENTVSAPSRITFSSQLVAFDKAWCSYLYQFVVWKVKDAKLLEEDLVTAACQLELSMMQACGLVPGGENGLTTHDVKEIQKQILENQKLLRTKLQDLSGNAGLQHLESALSKVRSRFAEAKVSGSSLASLAAHVSIPQQPGTGTSSVGLCSEITDVAEGSKSSNYTIDSSFVNTFSSGREKLSQCNSFVDGTADHLGSDMIALSENELLVNEVVHERRRGFSDIFGAGSEEQSSLQKQVKETMEKAFWDGVIETLKQDKPDFSWVLKLVKEVRDELCEMSPRIWRQEIIESMDIDILSQVLSSGKLDMDFLGKMLNYALVTLRKLAAPANDGNIEATHHKLLKDLEEISQSEDKSNASFAMLIMKGLRFVLEQIQTLRKEISKARMRMLEPLIKGPAGLEYLKKAFVNRYGNPPDAIPSLQLTKNWLSLLVSILQQEWEEYTDSLSAIRGNDSLSTRIPPITLQTGGSMSAVSARISSTAGNEQPECRGERMDLLVRLGLLKLVSQIVGLTPEMLPETLKLNFARIRSIQSLFQKVIVAATSVLVLRQILLSEKLVTSPVDMENLLSKCVRQLFELLDNIQDAGIAEIVQTISAFPEGCEAITDQEKLQARKQIISNMLAKSLQAGDPIFERVSRVIYLAARGAVLGGSGNKGRQLAETALKRVGAAFLTDKVMEVAEGLIAMATVSCSVHGPWYEELLKGL